MALLVLVTKMMMISQLVLFMKMMIWIMTPLVLVTKIMMVVGMASLVLIDHNIYGDIGHGATSPARKTSDDGDHCPVVLIAKLAMMIIGASKDITLED